MGIDAAIQHVSSALAWAMMATEDFRCENGIHIGKASRRHVPGLRELLAARDIHCDRVSTEGGNFRLHIGDHYIFA